MSLVFIEIETVLEEDGGFEMWTGNQMRRLWNFVERDYLSFTPNLFITNSGPRHELSKFVGLRVKIVYNFLRLTLWTDLFISYTRHLQL